MKITKGKNKEEYYKELAIFYRVHYNTIRKIIVRGKNGDFSVHKSTIKANQGYKIKEIFKTENKIQWFKNKGITIKKLLSDNGLEFTTHHVSSRKYHSFEIMLEQLNIVHKYTKIRRPQTNGKIERFWRIFEEQFFRKYEFLSNKDFNLKLQDWLVFYNTKRKHGGIKYITPMQKLENLLENNLVCL